MPYADEPDLLTTSTADQSAMTTRLGQNLVIQRRLVNAHYRAAACTPAVLNRTQKANRMTYPILGEIEGGRLTSVIVRGQIHRR